MIAPHGGSLVNRVVGETHRDQICQEIDDGPVIRLTSRQYQEVINVATGRFSPLEGFMTQNDFLKVVNDMTLEDGTVWPLPIALDVGIDIAEEVTPGRKVGLADPAGETIGAIEVEEVFKDSKRETAANLFGTDDDAHPGVRSYLARGDFLIGGEVYLFAEHRQGEHDLLPAETRVLFKSKGWSTVVGFQTRNAPHRAHEYIQKTALEQTGGLLIQPKIGDKKDGDYRDDAIQGAYRRLLANYYNEDRVALTIFPSEMYYAGPKEAVFDAIVRKNHGCTHFVVGRDHAGVGDFYDEFAAQRIFGDVADIGITPLFYDYCFYCRQCDGMASEYICPHVDEHRIEPSGSEIRRLIRGGERPSEKMMRPEVAEYLMDLDEPFVTDESAREEVTR